jgi:ribonucleoside-diphosphate reductase alpha chain
MVGVSLKEVFMQEVSKEVLLEKYAKGEERTAQDIFRRVARALASVERDPAVWEQRFYDALAAGFIPAGRILSAAGAGIEATLINCFVQPVGDSVSEEKDGKPGIYIALREAAETMRRGGGVGYDFSRIRPRGAHVKGTASRASGPVSYMRVFDRSCETVESAGARRGAQMGVLRCDHPDVFEFVNAKNTQGELTNFNISVGVTEAFMRAVESDGEWELAHQAEPGLETIAAGAYRREDGMWVYRKIRARELWEAIMRNTYAHAEPGVLFIDRMNSENNLWYCETIEASNPCVTSDTWVLTGEGSRQVKDLIGKPFVAIVDGMGYPTGPSGFYRSGTKDVVRLAAQEGFSARLTANHRVRKVTRKSPYVIETDWVEAGSLNPGDEVLMQDHRRFNGWQGRATWGEGYLLGLLVGDGHLKEDKAVLAVWDNRMSVAANGDCVVSPAAKGIMDTALEIANSMKHRRDFKGWLRVTGRNEFRLSTGELKKLALSYGMAPGAKGITLAVEEASSDFYRGFLRGLFDTDGTVGGNQQKGVSVRLSQGKMETLEAAQRMLLRLGIFSVIYTNRQPGGPQIMPNGKGGTAVYQAQARHDLVIANENLTRFQALIGFSDAVKAEKLSILCQAYVRAPNRERFIATVRSIESCGSEDVYDVEVQDLHEFDANGFHAHNCAEQPLPDYGCCCLGSIDLTRFVRKPFTDEASFDFAGFGEVACVAIRMLDNVLDVTYWPLPQQKSEAMSKRRVGLGFTGLGDALAMLGLRYDTEGARSMAAEMAEVMRDQAYSASVDLAREKGTFPLFNAEKYLEGGFAKRLPLELRNNIGTYGIRNSHLLSIAPTGTISLAFADNASNGIEPPYSWSYTRKKRQPDGTVKKYTVEDHACRLYREMGGDPNNLPSYFVTALAIAAKDHLAMVAAVAPFIDTSISKTVNVPGEYPYADFQDLYLEAWKSGVKGLATFRPNDITGSVLSVATPKETAAVPAQPDLDQSDPDRRIHLKEVPTPPIASLRWRKRPDLPAGNPAWCYLVSHPHGHKFGLFIGHIENGTNHAFEVWVNGVEQPRGLGALAKSLSMDMRSNDHAWLKCKLESLARAAGDDGFDLSMPPEGRLVRVPSLVAGVARLVLHRCAELGTFSGAGETPVLNALMSPKEPKTGSDGSIGWYVDILNPNTGDDFVMGVKELVLPNGQRRPYSLWLSGEYPRVLDGLCKSLSFDMRVIDPTWVGGKLRQLLDYAEPRGDFLARAPRSAKQENFPSTVAYLARLLIHRYAMLGILDEEGYALEEMGVVQSYDDNIVPLKARSAGAMEVQPGRLCKQCRSYAVIKKDGCEFCTACGEVGACG